jgi:hypothetical protein
MALLADLGDEGVELAMGIGPFFGEHVELELGNPGLVRAVRVGAVAGSMGTSSPCTTSCSRWVSAVVM